MPNTLTPLSKTIHPQTNQHPPQTKASNMVLPSFAKIQPHGQHDNFSRKRDLPVRGRAQGGLDGNLVVEEHPIDWTFRPADLQGVHNAFAVFVTGDSMMPKYKNRDIAYIHPTHKLRRGRYVLVETKAQGGFIKEFDGWDKETLKLKQYNPVRDLHFDRQEILNVMLVIGSLDA